MARHKDATWNLNTPPGIDGAALAALMDIRDELKILNRQVGYVVTGVGYDSYLLKALRGLRRDVKAKKRCRRVHA